MTLSVTHSTVTGAAADSTALVDGVAWDAAHTLSGTASAAQLNENVVQSVTNDTNVTGSIASQALTLGWTGTLSPARGGTGVANNAASTWTISGAYAATITLSGATTVTFPTTGTLATLAGSETFTNKTLTSPIITGATLGAATLGITGKITPSQITSDQNDYAPTGLSTATVVRISSDAARNITGLSAGSDGDIKIVENVGAFSITLKDESASSTAANRFALTSDQILSPDSVVILKYDGTSARWRAAGGGGSTFLDSLFTLQDNSDTTKQAQFQLSGITTATTRTWTFPDANDTFLGLTATQSPTNKTFDNTNTVTLKDTLFTLQDNSDTSKQAQFQLSGITTATTRTYTFPDTSDTLVTLAATQELDNKTIDSAVAKGTWTQNGSTPWTVNAGSAPEGLWVHGTTGTWDPTDTNQTRPFGSASGLGIMISTQTTDASPAFMAAGYGGTGGGFRGGAAGGTAASPTAVGGGALLSYMGGHGYDGSAWTTGTKALLGFWTTAGWSGSSNPTHITLETTPSGSTTRAEALRAHGSGGVSVGTTTDPGIKNLKIAGHLQTKAPVSSATDYTLLADDSSVIFTNSGGSSTLTLLTASSYVGRDLWLKTTEAQTVVSASSNVVPKVGGAAGTAILPATDGAWAYLKSDGTNWVIMASGT